MRTTPRRGATNAASYRGKPRSLAANRISTRAERASKCGESCVRLREANIVARRRNVLVFVEVKAREDRSFGEAAEAVTARKRRRIVRLAMDYVMRHHLANDPCRFDVVSIHFDAGRPAIEIFQNAFDAGIT